MLGPVAARAGANLAVQVGDRGAYTRLVCRGDLAAGGLVPQGIEH
jgi:hypothetical protein